MTSVEPPCILTASQSWALVRETLVGRLAVVVDDLPEIFPINFVVDHGTVVFRTAAGTKLRASINQPVAFELDGYDPSTGEAWSVVIKGICHAITGLDEVLDALVLPLETWHAAAKPQLVRIVPTNVSGRRFRRAAPPREVALLSQPVPT